LREGRGIEFDGHQIALFNLGDRFLAVENRCPQVQIPAQEQAVEPTTA
jgi:nitrite reductase/ring-hydroxylating ferredoxin subunit